MRICAVVAGKNLKEFLSNLRIAQKQADWVELRADYIKNLKPEHISAIKRAVKKSSIFTCRKKSEGGKFLGAEKERLAILNTALKSGFDFVDIELPAISKIKIPGGPDGSKIICSYHDFKKTPALPKLKDVVKKMRASKADMMKIVTMVNDEKDNQKLFKLLAGRKKNQEMIVLGMGEKGKITRLLSPLWGGFLTFASIGKTTAPGQLTAKELKNVYRKMGIIK